MKTHEQIKKGLECCTPVWTGNHWKTCDPECPYLAEGSFCRAVLSKDVGEEIRRLESKLAEYEKPLVPMMVDSIATNMRFLLPCWIETKSNMWPDVLDRDSVGNYGKIDNRERVTVRYLMDADYGKTWRCWSRKPTNEERKAAKWDK